MIRPFLPFLFLAGCAALGSAAELAPAGPVYATADQRPFWYATILDWTFTCDAYSPVPDFIPERLVEVALWRGQVTDTVKGPGWKGENWLVWTRTAAHSIEVGGTMTVPLGRAKVELVSPTVIGACPLWPGYGDVMLDLTSGSPVDYRMQADDDFSVILVGLGIPDLALGQRPGPGVDRQSLPDGTPGWTWNEPHLTRTVGPLDLGRIDLGGMKLDLIVNAQVSGTADGRMDWDASAGRPRWSTVKADLEVNMTPMIGKPLPKDFPAQEIHGRLAIRRHCWMLPDSAGQEVPRDLPRLLTSLAAQALIDGKPTSWADLARSTDKDLAAVAAGVEHAAAHPPEIRTGGADSPKTGNAR